MFTRKIKFLAALAFCTLLLSPTLALAAADASVNSALVAKAETFVHSMASGNFTAAEADFTDQMKQAAPPLNLKQVWGMLVQQAGAFQKTDKTETVITNGYTSVIVNTEFKDKTLGIAITFDSAGKIAGMHFVPAS
ncbi:MAG: DUF3887 domain-containing protein [Gammaproteobacteria bacterium]